MRSDYALYSVGIILFVITCVVLLYPVEYQQVFVVATAVGGLFFIGLGYTQRPKPEAKTIETTAPPTVETVREEEKPAAITEPMPPDSELTKVKGIGVKRADQLKALGINSIRDLANASAKDLAAKLEISPKITTRWIENAKALTEKS